MTESAAKEQNANSRIARAALPLRSVLPAALFWALICAVTCTITLVWFRGWALNAQTWHVVSFYTAGAILALYPATFITRLIAPNRSLMRLALFSLLLAAGTFVLTATIFALQYRLYFVQWHGEPFSRLWLWQQFFTAGGAVYTYAVLGLRLYLPLGLLGLFVTSWWVNRLAD